MKKLLAIVSVMLLLTVACKDEAVEAVVVEEAAVEEVAPAVEKAVEEAAPAVEEVVPAESVE